jgi:SAM-dependent methyltransferase
MSNAAADISSSTSATVVKVDFSSPEYRADLNHLPFWQHFVDSISEKDLRNSTVLDFGCGRGMFLHTLFYRSPFKKGYGVDISTAAIATARTHTAYVPVEYFEQSNPSCVSNIDIAMSHEVLYQLPDLTAHAKDMHACLRTGGVYYIALACIADNPLWPLWKSNIEKGGITAYTHTADEIVKAFVDNGFDVYARKFVMDDFVKMVPGNANYHTLTERMDNALLNKFIFRAVKL